MRLRPIGDGIGTLPPASFGMSSAVAGAPVPGERVIMPDDNFNNPTAPVLAYRMPTPRTHGYALLQTAHYNLWGSSDFGTGAGGDNSGSDATHPCVWTILTGTTTTGHVGVVVGGDFNFNLFSATSHQRIYDCTFMIPVLSDGANTFNVRLGNVSASFGSIANGAYIEVNSNAAANIQCFTADTSTRTQTDSGVAVVAGTWYRVRIVVTNNASADFYIAQEGTALPSTPTVTITTNIPSGTAKGHKPGALVEKSAGTTGRSLSLNYVISGIDRLAA